VKQDHFEEIYLANFSKMKHFAREYVLSEEEAENIVQDVFTELWEKRTGEGCYLNNIGLPVFSLRQPFMV
jgi:DNA-directed RNA polymerase specialized sigma24 family protein